MPRLFLVLALFSTFPAADAAPHRQRRLLLGSPGYRAKFFPSLKWRLEIGMRASCAPAAADRDLDGKVELFVPSVDGRVYCLSPQGGTKWAAQLGAPLTAGVALGDADGDGSLELVAAAGKRLVCLDTAAKPEWSFEAGDRIECMPVIADLDRDDHPEVCVGSNDNFLYCLDRGQVKWRFETDSWVTSSPAIADLGGDEGLEVCFGSLDAIFYCLDAAGKEVWRYKTGGWIESSPAIGDIDRDGSPEICFASNDGWLYCLSANGKLEWKGEIGGSPDQHSTGAVTLADLDGDGTLETLFGTATSRLYCFTAQGETAWVAHAPAPLFGSPLVADLNRDSYQEVLAACADGKVYCYSTWGGQVWSAHVGSPVTATPLLADLDGDGKHELYAGSLPSEAAPRGFLTRYVITTVGGETPWAAAKGDPYRTGCAPNALDYGRALKLGNDYAAAWEPFGAGSRPATRLLPPRRVDVVVEGPLDDAAPGNRNGVLEARETGILRVRVANRGAAPVYETMLTLDPGKSGLLPNRTRAFLGRLPAGGARVVRFDLSASPRIRGPSAQIALTATESGVNVGFATMDVAVSPPIHPYLRVYRVSVLDRPGKMARGNGNGRLDAGEQALLRILVQNDGPVTARAARARLLSHSEDVLAATPEAAIGDLVPGGGRNLQFSVRAAKKLSGKQADLALEFSSRGAPTRREPLRLPLKPSPLDVTPPVIAIRTPARDTSATFADTVVIQGTITDAAGIARVLLGGIEVAPGCLRPLKEGRGVALSILRHLELGENFLAVTAVDGAGNTATHAINVVRRPK